MTTETQFTVAYLMYGTQRHQSFSQPTAEDAVESLLRNYPGIKRESIVSVTETTPEPVRRSSNSTRTRPQFSLAPEKQLRLVEIFKNDPRFHMPISSPPEQEDAAIDEISKAEDGLTIASDRKQFVSYDTVFSTSEEVDALLAGSGAYAAPYFDSKEISLLHGSRKAFYLMLIKHGLTPSRLSN